jgi:hypothetical protein
MWKTSENSGNDTMPASVHDSIQILASRFSPLELDRIARKPNGQSTLFALVRAGEVDLDDAARAIGRARPFAHHPLSRLAMGLRQFLLPWS